MIDPCPWGDLRPLRTAAEALVDATKARVSAGNRAERGATADKMTGAALLASAKAHEKICREILMDVYTQRIPAHVREWAAGIPGIATGELFPKLLGLTGHPRIAVPWHWEGKVLVPAGEPYERTLRQWWQWCGCGDPERVPGKNASREELLACGKRRTVRPVLYTFTTYLVLRHTRSDAIAQSRYYKTLVEAKDAAQGNTHDRQCQNRNRPPLPPNGCGTVAHPERGEPGSPWQPGHINAHGHRLAQKEFMRDLFEVSALPE